MRETEASSTQSTASSRRAALVERNGKDAVPVIGGENARHLGARGVNQALDRQGVLFSREKVKCGVGQHVGPHSCRSQSAQTTAISTTPRNGSNQRRQRMPFALSSRAPC